MAKIVITIMDLPEDNTISIDVQSENLEMAETPAVQCATETLDFLFSRVEDASNEPASFNEGAKH